MVRHLLLSIVFIFLLSDDSFSQEHSVARELNEIVLHSIRNDFARPTVHARNLWHTSMVMHDIWAVVTGNGEPYLLGNIVGDFVSTFPEFTLELTEEEEQAYLDEAISTAVARIILHRFQWAPKFGEIYGRLEGFMTDRGYNIEDFNTDYPEDQSAEALGYYVAQQLISFGLRDRANDLRYWNEFYRPVNDPILVTEYGNGDLRDPNRWQPLAFTTFIDQSGNVALGNVPQFLSPEWGEVTAFALDSSDLTIYEDSMSNKYYVYHDPGNPPYLSAAADDQMSDDYFWGFSMVGIWASMLDPADGVMWDISPRSIGNVDELPTDFEGYKQFYDLIGGGDASRGRNINPVTGAPYEEQMVPRADYARVLAEFWADGPDSETPPGHWFSILHTVMDDPSFVRKWEGGGEEMDILEYDLRAFFTLGGAMHDAAISTWGIKGWYDYIRPVSSIRYMGTKGQSTDTSLVSYDPHGLPLIPGYIELIESGDSLAIADSTNIGKVKIKSWRGPDFIEDPDSDVAGVGWILAEAWWPYQRPTFVSPPFAGYTSGHSCFSRAAAEVLTMMTGDEYFPGGMGVFPVPKNEFLVFEDGPSVDMELQWATYRDASDQTSLSRIWGGIHPPQDDIPGRIIGITIGIDAYNKANTYFRLLGTSTYEEAIVSDVYKIYPNPISSSQRLNIEALDQKEVRNVKAELYDINGRKVRSEVIRTAATSLDMRGLIPGNYVIHIIDEDRRQISELILVD